MWRFGYIAIPFINVSTKSTIRFNILSPIFFAKVFVINEPKNLVTKFVGIHFATQDIGNIPKLYFYYSFIFFAHNKTT